jgi:hypothetical protein
MRSTRSLRFGQERMEGIVLRLRAHHGYDIARSEN